MIVGVLPGRAVILSFHQRKGVILRHSILSAMSNLSQQLYQLGVLSNQFLQIASPYINQQGLGTSPLGIRNNFSQPQFIQPVVTPTTPGSARSRTPTHNSHFLTNENSPQVHYSAYVQTAQLTPDGRSLLNSQNVFNSVQYPPAQYLQVDAIDYNSSPSIHGNLATNMERRQSLTKDSRNLNERYSYPTPSTYRPNPDGMLSNMNDRSRSTPSGHVQRSFSSSQYHGRPDRTVSPLVAHDDRRAPSPAYNQSNAQYNNKGLKRQYDDSQPSPTRKRQRSNEGIEPHDGRQSDSSLSRNSTYQSSPGFEQWSQDVRYQDEFQTKHMRKSLSVQNIGEARSSPYPVRSSSASSTPVRGYQTQAANTNLSRETRQQRRGSQSTLVQLPDESGVPPADYSSFEQISAAIWQNFVNSRQSEDMYKKKLNLRNALFSMIKGIFPYCGLYVVGSSMNGFGNETSDMDMCVMVTEGNINQKKQATEILRVLHKAVRKCSFIKHCDLIRAKVPILKFKDTVSGIECDININNLVGIRNTHLLAFYAKADWRVRPLVLYVKRWAKFHNINDASRCTISSYSLVLMVIHYLQAGCEEPVLPSLQAKFPAKFSPTSDVRNLRLDEEVPPYHTLNKQSLGELFLGFLHYYAEVFKFEVDAISIRLGSKIPIHSVIDMSRGYTSYNPNQWKFLSIEEPFDLSNTARSVWDGPRFQQVRSVINRSYQVLKRTHDVTKIMTVPF